GAVNFAQPLLVHRARIHQRLAMIGTDKKTAGAAGGIEHDGVMLANTKRIEHIDEVFTGVMLAEFVSLFGINEALENAAEDVAANLAEIERSQICEHGSPRIDGVVMLKNERPGPVFCVRIKERFVIAR